MFKKKEKLSLALISTDYPPLCTSASVQMYDLAKEMVKQGHEITMIVPTSNLQSNWLVETVEDVNILRLAAPSIKDIGYFRRTLSELSLPLLMIYRILLGPYAYKNWDIVVWYSPTIFFGPLIWFLKKKIVVEHI